MSQSLVKNYVHIVFSTKDRQAFIKKEIESELLPISVEFRMN